MNENFVSAITPPDSHARPAYWFLFHKYNLLVQVDETTGAARVPYVVSPASLALTGWTVIRQQYLGYLDKAERTHCYAAELTPATSQPSHQANLANQVANEHSLPLLPSDMALLGLRSLFGRLPEPDFWLAGRAVQLVDWERTHQFCGQCGSKTQTAPNERAKKCPNCGQTNYPRLSPAVIVRVEREGENGREILLARHRRYGLPIYSVLAGFVEPGETLETCVQREIREEVGLTVKNIHYFGSQPWPFPNSLMIAFTADYAAGEVTMEEAELVDAQWFRPDNLPPYPPPLSIAHQLIRDFIQKEGG